MKDLIKKILKEDFDWVNDIPSFIEITEPVAQNNPKDVFRLYWTHEHYTSDGNGVWSNDWVHFKNDSEGINKLTRYIRILENGLTVYVSNFDFDLLVNLYFDQGHDYIATDWMKKELSGLPDDEDYMNKKEALSEMLKQDLSDLGIYDWDSSTLEKWKITYFDENGIEFNTKINKV